MQTNDLNEKQDGEYTTSRSGADTSEFGDRKQRKGAETDTSNFSGTHTTGGAQDVRGEISGPVISGSKGHHVAKLPNGLLKFPEIIIPDDMRQELNIPNAVFAKLSSLGSLGRIPRFNHSVNSNAISDTESALTIGRWGEELVVQYLLLSHPNGTVKWMNELQESGCCYDIELTVDSRTTCIIKEAEVKEKMENDIT